MSPTPTITIFVRHLADCKYTLQFPSGVNSLRSTCTAAPPDYGLSGLDQYVQATCLFGLRKNAVKDKFNAVGNGLCRIPHRIHQVMENQSMTQRESNQHKLPG